MSELEANSLLPPLRKLLTNCLPKADENQRISPMCLQKFITIDLSENKDTEVGKWLKNCYKALGDRSQCSDILMERADFVLKEHQPKDQ